MSFIGGKKHSVKHVKKASRRKTRNNKVLKSWIGFVKKVQKDENIKSYKNAMMRAKARKSEWNKAMKGGVGEMIPAPTPIVEETPVSEEMNGESSTPIEESSTPLDGNYPPVNQPVNPPVNQALDTNLMGGGRKTKRANRRRSSRKNRASRRR
jgi:hypothetical protein